MDEFRYVGMNLKRIPTGIIVDQDHYINTFEVPDMEISRGQIMSDLLNSEGQTLFRGHVSRVLHIGYLSRPDVLFDAKCLSTKFGHATKSDLKSVQKKIQKLQGVPTRKFFLTWAQRKNSLLCYVFCVTETQLSRVYLIKSVV